MNCFSSFFEYFSLLIMYFMQDTENPIWFSDQLYVVCIIKVLEICRANSFIDEEADTWGLSNLPKVTELNKWQSWNSDFQACALKLLCLP